jgi:uncharacterized protein YcfL
MKKLLSVVAVISMVAFGCAHKPIAENCPVAFMSNGIAKCVTVVSVQQNTTPDGRLRIAANLQSLANHPLEMQVNCVFKDQQGFSTGDETPWQTLILTEHAQETVTFVAMNTQAKKATIRVRETR